MPLKHITPAWRAALWLAVLSLALSGCLYPRERRLENQVPSTIYLEATQKAVDQFREREGVLPIITRPADTPVFERYEIDFHRLTPMYLPDVPANAFEKGGFYKYVLIDVETKPTVRLINLDLVSQVADVQQAVDRYVHNFGKLPVERDLGNGYYTIDFRAIGSKIQQVPSMVTNQYLPLVMDARGTVGVDYAADIAAVLHSGSHKVPTGEDPRFLLARESLFVPVKSFPYKLQNGEPHLAPM